MSLFIVSELLIFAQRKQIVGLAMPSSQLGELETLQVGKHALKSTPISTILKPFESKRNDVHAVIRK